ncbi:MAG: tetratricopeptide repeat protein [Mariniblastus sp.]|nr:tetratricopeptide repeat protein [Mariniblastus sp.]
MHHPSAEIHSLEEKPTQERIFQGMGNHHRTITTQSAETQKYFDQALTWAYGFNHDEAIRSLLAATKHDPDAAMPWWGIAYCEGPNYNLPITPERSKAAWYAIQNALARKTQGTVKERALIEAMHKRYAMPIPEDRTELDRAYADAMQTVWASYPDDPDVGTLYAESLMLLRPWKLYTSEGEPVEDTDTIVQTLESVLKIQPDHPGANHLYVHAMEPSNTPDKALPAAHALDNLIPASGHLLHMPSHIYVRTGHWDKAITQNQKAIIADAEYLKLSPVQTMQHIYMIHNSHMLAYAAMMSGQEKEAMKAARLMQAQANDGILESFGPVLDRWMCSVYDVQKRFGRWDSILAEPAPPETLPITTAIWRAHRAIAFAAKRDFPNAEKEYTSFRTVRESIPLEVLAAGDMDDRFLEVSDLFIRGEIALQKQRWNRAIELLTKAADIESTLAYGEPPQWTQPVRHTLGAVLLAAGRYAAAETCYRKDLEKWPNNGWSLFGLSRSLEGQGKTDEAKAVYQQYEAAWSHADEAISTSCKCIPKT